MGQESCKYRGDTGKGFAMIRQKTTCLALIALVSVLPSLAQAQQPKLTPKQVPLLCMQRERDPTALLVTARDELHTPREQFIASLGSGALNVKGRQMMVERVNDVYDNPSLTHDTLWTFRSYRCIEEFARKDFVSFKPELKPALLECQATHGDRMVELAECVADASAANIEASKHWSSF
jgi:hypothetical protein